MAYSKTAHEVPLTKLNKRKPKINPIPSEMTKLIKYRYPSENAHNGHFEKPNNIREYIESDPVIARQVLTPINPCAQEYDFQCYAQLQGPGREAGLRDCRKRPNIINGASVPPELQRFSRALQSHGNDVGNDQDIMPPPAKRIPLYTRSISTAVQTDPMFVITEAEYKRFMNLDIRLGVVEIFFKFLKSRNTEQPNIEKQKNDCLMGPPDDVRLVNNNKNSALGKVGNAEAPALDIVNSVIETPKDIDIENTMLLKKVVAYSDYNKRALRKQFEAYQKNEIAGNKISDKQNTQFNDTVAKDKPTTVGTEKPDPLEDMEICYGDESMYVVDPNAYKTAIRLHAYNNDLLMHPVDVDTARGKDAVPTVSEHDMYDETYLARRRTMPVKVPTARQRPPISISPHERPAVSITPHVQSAGYMAHHERPAGYMTHHERPAGYMAHHERPAGYVPEPGAEYYQSHGADTYAMSGPQPMQQQYYPQYPPNAQYPTGNGRPGWHYVGHGVN